MSEQKSLRETEIQEGKVISQGHMENEWKRYDWKYSVLVPGWFLSQVRSNFNKAFCFLFFLSF